MKYAYRHTALLANSLSKTGQQSFFKESNFAHKEIDILY